MATTTGTGTPGFGRRPDPMSRPRRAKLDHRASRRPNRRRLAVVLQHDGNAGQKIGWGAPLTVVTQNIDNLHQDAGSTTVYAVHGTLFEVVYADLRFLRLMSRRELTVVAARLAKLRRAWLLPLARLVWALRPLIGLKWTKLYRPKLVLFGDAMCEPDWSQAVAAAQACDCVLQVGCSGQVFPAAMLTLTAKEHGAAVIAIDPEDTASDLWLRGTAGDMLPRLLQAAFDTDEPH